MRKPYSNSVLHGLPEERQAQIAEWCAKANDLDSDGKPMAGTGGLAFARAQLAADGCKVSLDTLSRWLASWKLRQQFGRARSAAEEAEELLRQVDPSASAEKLRAFGQLMFMQRAVAAENTEDFVGLTIADTKARELEAKINGFKLKYEQKEREMELARQKFQRDTAKLFLKWSEDERAKQIVTGSGTNSEKIEALGQAMFGEDWGV